jgi:hypothetical protein
MTTDAERFPRRMFDLQRGAVERMNNNEATGI